MAQALLPHPIYQYIKTQRAYSRKKKQDAETARVEKIKASEFYVTYFKQKVDAIYPLVRATHETHNFTYDLTNRNLWYLADTIGCALGKPREEIEAYIEEAKTDRDINAAAIALTPEVRVASPFGRRLGWYAVARALKPKTIVETGVDRGHGSLILCAALLRNAAEGHPGRYFGTDLRTEAGQLLAGKYAEMGKILYGDSIESLERHIESVDLFINDSDHSDDYEYREYVAIQPKLTPRAIILGDNAHVTDKLARFSRETGRKFLFFREEPKDHWYPGAGIGISFGSQP
jgi:predicted O-methyltransferase YrrM